MNPKNIPARIPVKVVGAPAPVEPPVLKWFNGPAPKDAADEYTRSEIISEACIRATVKGGAISGHALDVASERNVRLDPARPLP